MALIKLVEENEASGVVRDVYQDIKSTLGIDFVRVRSTSGRVPEPIP